MWTELSLIKHVVHSKTRVCLSHENQQSNSQDIRQVHQVMSVCPHILSLSALFAILVAEGSLYLKWVKWFEMSENLLASWYVPFWDDVAALERHTVLRTIRR